MKKSPPSPAPSVAPPARFWRPVAWLSLVANVALLVWIWRVAAVPPVAPASAEAAVSPVAAPVASQVLPSRELAPYRALGSFMAENNRIPDLGWTEAQFATFQEGFRASYEGRGLPLDDAAKRLAESISQRVQGMLASEQPDPLATYFRELREKEGVSATASGLHYRQTEPGEGPSPGARDTVVISYAARLPDGTSLPQFTRTRVRMAVADLLPGLAEGVQLLAVGGKALVYLPPALSFAGQPWPAGIPQGAPIVFFLELHEIMPP